MLPTPEEEKITDSEVIAQSMAQPEKFAVLYDRYANVLYRYAYSRVGADAEDVVASSFLAAFQARHRYDQVRPEAKPWLFGILTKEIARRHRTELARYRAMLKLPVADVTPGVADDVVGDVIAQTARHALIKALAKLSSGDRDTLLLIAWSGLSYEEAAAALRIPIGTVRSRLNRARRKMRDALRNSDLAFLTHVDKEPTWTT